MVVLEVLYVRYEGVPRWDMRNVRLGWLPRYTLVVNNIKNIQYTIYINIPMYVCTCRHVKECRHDM